MLMRVDAATYYTRRCDDNSAPGNKKATIKYDLLES
jgi:hypothetical protein